MADGKQITTSTAWSHQNFSCFFSLLMCPLIVFESGCLLFDRGEEAYLLPNCFWVTGTFLSSAAELQFFFFWKLKCVTKQRCFNFGYHYNKFTCFGAQTTHRFSHTLQCSRTFPLCVKQWFSSCLFKWCRLWDFCHLRPFKHKNLFNTLQEGNNTNILYSPCSTHYIF